MATGSVTFLTQQQTRDMAELAELAKVELTRFAGYEVAYDATVPQLLDEWIDRHLRQVADPSQRMRLYWASFLGEMFRRRHGGEWVIHEPERGSRKLSMLCPAESGGIRTVEISDQINRRIAEGMSASLAYFYMAKSIELRAR